MEERGPGLGRFRGVRKRLSLMASIISGLIHAVSRITHSLSVVEAERMIGIDKRSSAELTEAINSMYTWYQNAQECYVYLSDVPEKPWEQSRWFTRGKVHALRIDDAQHINQEQAGRSKSY